MTNLYSAQLDLPAGAHSPDPWDYSGGGQLRPDHVISKDAEGKPLSRVGDLLWNWTFCTPLKEPSYLHFHFWKTKGNQTVREDEITAPRLALIREMQYLLIIS